MSLLSARYVGIMWIGYIIHQGTIARIACPQYTLIFIQAIDRVNAEAY